MRYNKKPKQTTLFVLPSHPDKIPPHIRGVKRRILEGLITGEFKKLSVTEIAKAIGKHKGHVSGTISKLKKIFPNSDLESKFKMGTRRTKKIIPTTQQKSKIKKMIEMGKTNEEIRISLSLSDNFSGRLINEILEKEPLLIHYRGKRGEILRGFILGDKPFSSMRHIDIAKELKLALATTSNYIAELRKPFSNLGGYQRESERRKSTIIRGRILHALYTKKPLSKLRAELLDKKLIPTNTTFDNHIAKVKSMHPELFPEKQKRIKPPKRPKRLTMYKRNLERGNVFANLKSNEIPETLTFLRRLNYVVLENIRSLSSNMDIARGLGFESERSLRIHLINLEDANVLPNNFIDSYMNNFLTKRTHYIDILEVISDVFNSFKTDQYNHLAHYRSEKSITQTSLTSQEIKKMKRHKHSLDNLFNEKQNPTPNEILQIFGKLNYIAPFVYLEKMVDADVIEKNFANRISTNICP